MSHDVTGRCLCGAVTFSARLENAEVGVCHCGMCRRWSAGPFFFLGHGGAVRFTGEDNIQLYRSSKWGERGFCKRCGSALFWKQHGKDHYDLSAGALDTSDGLMFTKQIFMDDKPAYYEFANETRKLTGEDSLAEEEAARKDG